MPEGMKKVCPTEWVAPARQADYHMKILSHNCLNSKFACFRPPKNNQFSRKLNDPCDCLIEFICCRELSSVNMLSKFCHVCAVTIYGNLIFVQYLLEMGYFSSVVLLWGANAWGKAKCSTPCCNPHVSSNRCKRSSLHPPCESDIILSHFLKHWSIRSGWLVCIPGVVNLQGHMWRSRPFSKFHNIICDFLPCLTCIQFNCRSNWRNDWDKLSV